jgi:hypothetical protein
MERGNIMKTIERTVNGIKQLVFDRERKDPFICDGPCNGMIAENANEVSSTMSYLIEHSDPYRCYGLYCGKCLALLLKEHPDTTKILKSLPARTHMWEALDLDEGQKYSDPLKCEYKEILFFTGFGATLTVCTLIARSLEYNDVVIVSTQ